MRDSVSHGWPFLWGIGYPIPRCGLPERTSLAGTVARRTTSPLLFGLAPDGVCRAAPVAGDAVGSYPTVSPLPATAWNTRPAGGLFSVALSVGLPRLGVTQHPVLRSSDFPHPNGCGHPVPLPFLPCVFLRSPACRRPGSPPGARAGCQSGRKSGRAPALPCRGAGGTRSSHGRLR